MKEETILETLDNLGFKTEKADDIGYSFEYEGSTYLYMPIESDESFLNISIPGICDIDEDTPETANALINKINSTVKYVKAYPLGGRVWLFYEREVYGDEDMGQIVSDMIVHLEASLAFARKVMADKDGADGNTENDTEEINMTDDNDEEE